MGAVLQNRVNEETTELAQYMQNLGRQARSAAHLMAQFAPDAKNAALLKIGQIIDSEREMIQRENARDMQQGKADGLSDAMLDRLLLSDDPNRCDDRGLTTGLDIGRSGRRNQRHALPPQRYPDW